MKYTDKIYGTFELRGVIEELINTSIFQRLKSIHRVALLLGIVLMCSSCNGQVKNEAQTEQPAIGKRVNTLDPMANLIYHDKEDVYWFGSKEKGIYRYDGKQLKLFTTADGLINHRIISVQEDKHGNLYFDTPAGISKFDGQTFTTLEVDENGTTKQEWKLEKDDLWFSAGWEHKGPYRFDGTNLYQLEFPKNELEDEFYSKYPNVSHSPYGIYSIYKDKKGNIWFGTSDMGIYQFDGENIRWMYERQLTETPGGGAFGIRSIAEDREGCFWICNADFKYKILPDSSKGEDLKQINYERETGIREIGDETQYFLSIVADDQGDLWMLTYDNGVWRNNGNTLVHYPIKKGEKTVLLSSIYKDNNGALWVGTHQDGAYKFNGIGFEKYSIE